MKRIIFLLQAIMVFQLLSAQNTFEKKYGNPGIYQCWGACAQQTVDSGYIITGTIVPYNKLADLYLAKMNSSGDTVWTKSYGSVNAETGQCVEQTSDGGFIIAATKSRYQASENEFWLVKTDAAGDTLWTKKVAPNYPNSEVSAKSVIQTNDGGYLIVGGGISALSSDYSNVKNIFLVKTSALGDTLWTKEYFGEVNDIKQTNDGGYVICGEYYEPSTVNGKWNALLMKLDSSGDSLWAKTYTSSGHANSIQQTQDQGYIITGTTEMISYGNSDIFLIKTNGLGDTLWTKTFGGAKIDEGHSVYQTSNGEFIVVGYTESFGESFGDAYLIKTDINGDTLWTKTFGYGGSSSTIGYSVNQTFDGGFIIGGEVKMLGSDFLYLLKTDNDGIINSINLLQNNKARLLENVFPNPVKSNATIKYHVPIEGLVTVTICDISGNKIIKLVDEEKQQGDYQITFNATSISSGTYLIKIGIGDTLSEIQKIVVFR